MCTGSGTTAHNPRSGGDPRLEGDPTPRRREPPQLEPVACRAHSHGLEVTHGQGCRSGGDPRPRLPPGVAVPDPCRSEGDPRPSLPPGVAVPTGMSFAASPSLSPWVAEISVWLLLLEINGLLKFLFGCCCWKLIWVGVGYFWWEVIIKK
jgi:hypothetical protein